MHAEMLLRDDVAAGRLVSLLEDHLPPPLPTHLIYPCDRQPTPKLTAFIDFMLERFGATEQERVPAKKTRTRRK